MSAAQLKDHVIVCGLGHVGFRIADLLLRLGERVAVVTETARSEWAASVVERGALIVYGDARDARCVAGAGIAAARALIAVTDHDPVNVEVALDARAAHPGLAVVVRLFDRSLAEELREGLELNGIFAMSSLAGPIFAAAGLGEELLATFECAGSAFVVSPGGVLRPRPAAAPMRQARSRLHTLLELPGAVFHGASRPLRILAVTLGSLMLVSGFVFWLGLRLGVVDAIYFLVTTLTTTGYGDINLKDSPAALKIYGSLVMVLGSAGMATLYSMLTDFIVKERFQELLGSRRIPERGHVVVVGLGTLGTRVVEELRARGEAVVGVDRDLEGPFVGALRASTALVVGEARLPATLERAGVSRARAVVATTGDDAVNLGVGLAARRLGLPPPRTVLRLFDGEFARKVQESLGVDVALSASRLAAPTFVAAALYDGTRAAWVEGSTLTVLVEKEPEPGETVALEHGGERLVSLRRPLR